MKKILCAIDFSAASLNALYFAHHLSSLYKGAELHLVTVQKDQLDDGVYNSKVFNLVNERKFEQALLNFQESVEASSSIKVKTERVVILSNQKVSQIISEKANEENFDLVCMGTEGLNNLRDHILGSTTRNVLKLVEGNLLAIPVKANFSEIQKLALGLDYMYFDEEKFEAVRDLTAIVGKQLSVFDVNIANNPLMVDRMKKLIDKYADCPEVDFHLIDSIEVVDGILRFSEKEKPDLLVLFSKKYSFLDKLFERSYTEELILHSHIPVLILKKI